jgi:thiamine kinase-like enzyme
MAYSSIREEFMTAITPFSPFSEKWIASHANQGALLTGGLSERNIVFEVDQKKYVLHTLENDSELYMMIETGNRDIAPKVINSFPEKKLVLMEYIQDSTITPKIAQRHCVEIGKALKKAHEIPLFKETGEGFEKENRVRWEYIQTQATRHNTDLSASLLKEATKAMQVFEKEMKSLDEINSNLKVNVHSDLHPRNLFWTDRGFLIIDWESSSHGHPYFDVASLAIFLGLDEAQEKELLDGYFGHLPNSEELKEYALLKKIRWAYTSIVNTMWAFRILEKQPASEPIEPPSKSFGDYMQYFGETSEMPSLEFFVNVSRLALKKTE